ncbi:MAG: restriction endonuclease [Methanosphaera sp.]|nr:restriction endonuclease [Methanosphaera sp.]
MEKERLVKFVATIMEENGFEVITNYAVADHVIDIYGTLQTNSGEVGVVVACKNYEEPWTIGIDVLKEMEVAARLVKASKIIIFTTSRYNHGAAVYAQRRNIKLVDRKGLLKIAQNYSKKRNIVTEEDAYEEEIYEEEDPICIETDNAKPALLYPQTNRTTNNTHRIFPTGFHRNNNNRTTNYRTNTLSNTHRTLDAGSIRNPVKFNVDLENLFEFFKNHSTIFLLLLIILCTLITYALNVITVGPYTGVGKILSCVILCYGGVALINKDLSDILFKGSVLFFISIIISIFTAKL